MSHKQKDMFSGDELDYDSLMEDKEQDWIIRGKTWDIREELQRWGCIWNGEERGYVKRMERGTIEYDCIKKIVDKTRNTCWMARRDFKEFKEQRLHDMVNRDYFIN